MKKLFFIIIFVFGFAFSAFSFAQGTSAPSGVEGMGFLSSSPDNAAIQNQQQEEQEGKKLLADLSDKITACAQLKDVDFEKIGEYFMGQAIGDTSRHMAMNEMMKRMMGETGEEQMHLAMGKRMSNCEPDAFMPQNMMNMMGGGMMGGGGNSRSAPWRGLAGLENFGTNPTEWGFGFSGWIFMILWWVLIILGLMVLIKWLIAQSRGSHNYERSPLEILKERYVKGEINKKEFGNKRKNLG